MLTRICSFLLLASSLLFFNFACQTGQFALQKEEEKLKPKLLVKAPDWVLLKGHPQYPQSQYLIGVGTSEKGPSQAGDAARAKVAQNLKMNISSTMVDISTTEKIHIERIIKTEVDAVLEGVEIKGTWPDQNNGVYYALAVVERNKAAFSIREKINKIESALLRNLNEGTEAENRADVISALSNYLSGYQKAPTLPPLKNTHYVITSSDEGPGSQNISTSEFESRIKNIVRNLNLTVVSGNQQIVKTLKGIAEPLVAKVYLFKEGYLNPVSNIPVIFNYETGQGELEGEKTSDSDGMVQTTIHKISSYKEANHVVTVKLDYHRIRSNFDEDFTEKFLSPLKSKRAIFNYAIQTPKLTSNKSQAWQQSITDLGNQIIKNIPPGKQPVLGVIPFKDLRHGQDTNFSRVLNEDIKTMLARADLKLKEIKINKDQQPEEIAKANDLDYYVIGSYRMERRGVEITSRLIEAKTNNVQSSANILIDRKELNPEDLKSFNKTIDEFNSAQMKKDYQDYLEKFIAVKPNDPSFNVKVRTNKKNTNNQDEYQIGEMITFFISVEKDCFLTLLDINPGGKITVLFPNKYQKNNFVRAGETIQIPPSQHKKFGFEVKPPHGEERLKAIATLDRDFPVNLNLNSRDGFHVIKPETSRGMREIEALANFFSSKQNSGWSQDYLKIFIHKKNNIFSRGQRTIPSMSEILGNK
mgnify:FL=1